MGQALYFVPPRGQFVDPTTGALTRVADLFLRGLYARVGGAVGDGTGDLSEAAFDDAGTEEQEAALYALADSAGQMPPPIHDTAQPDQIADQIADLREQVAVLMTRINDLEQGKT